MSTEERGPISEVVGGNILSANSSYGGNLAGMSKEQLLARLEHLYDADPDDEDSVQAFANVQTEIYAIEAELKWREQRDASK